MPAPRRTKAAEIDDVDHRICWGKTLPDKNPGISVRDHCLNVGCVAEALLALLPSHLRALLPPGAATLAALHDVGKVSPGFQVKCLAWLLQHGLVERASREAWAIGHEPDHAKVSQFTVQELLGRSQLHRWAAAVGAHHGRIKGERIYVHEPWEAARRQLAVDLINAFGPLPDEPDDEAVLWYLAGLITIADWLGSDETRFPQDAPWGLPERKRKAQAALVAAGWKPVEFRQQLGFGQLFPQYAANGLQTATIQALLAPGVYVIEGPMGCGKTEAALAAAYQLIASDRANGLYFALPTQVTSNRIYLRMHDFLERAAAMPVELRLAHSASWLVETNPPPALHPAIPDDAEAQEHVRAARSWFTSSKRALLAPFGVGTVDQALLGIVAANHFFVRQFGLAGKVVVLDEIHTYDLYTGTLIDVLVRRLLELHCTVIVLSATLTETRRRQLLQVGEDQPVSSAYPLLSGAGRPPVEVPCSPPQAKTVAVQFAEPTLLLEGCLERACQGQCVLWIRNTVDEAQETYCHLMAASHEGGPPIALLHSRFPFFRREELEAYWMEALGKDSTKRPIGCALVSTQVAEQSVDIDADLLVTDLAPTDMMLQRLGRLWRHDRPNRQGRPEIWIRNVPLSDETLREATEKELRAALGKSARVYAPYVLLRSLQRWRCRNAITLPTDIRAILEATYADPAANEPEAWRQLREQLEEQKRKLAGFALSATNVWLNPVLKDEEGVQTRHSTYPMAQLLLASEIKMLDSHSARLCLLEGTTVTAHDRDWSFATAKGIHRSLTRIPRWVFASVLAKPPGWLTNYVSQPTAVARLLPDGSIRWPGEEQPTGLSYHREQGIIIHPESVPRVSEDEFDESYD